MNFMPVIAMLIGVMLGWLAKADFDDWKERYHGIDKRDAERAVCAGKSCEQEN